MRTADELRASRQTLLDQIKSEKHQCRSELISGIRVHMNDRIEEFFHRPCDREFVKHSFDITGGIGTKHPQLDSELVEDAFDAVAPEWRAAGYEPELPENYDSKERANRVMFSIQLKFEERPQAVPY